MFLWFVAAAVATVLFVFDSPAIDYRFVVLGGILPLLEVVVGRPYVLHTLVGSVGLLALVMATTVKRRIVRRRLLGIPIGTFVFLVASTTWTTTALFWWPAGGETGFVDRPFPEFEHPIGVLLLLECFGLLLLAALVRRHGLAGSEARTGFLRTGRIPRPVERS